MRITEENFVSQIQMGNEQAIGYVIEHYGWIIKTVVRKQLYQLPHYEEECINDILLAVWQHSGRFNPEMNSFKNWLAGVSKYTALNYVRKHKKELEQQDIDTVDLATDDIAYEEVIKHEIGKDFEELLECIKEKDKELFIRLYVKEQSMEEVSLRMDMSKEVIYNRLSRAKNKMRKLFR